MAKKDDDMSPEERKEIRDDEWSKMRRAKNAKGDAINSKDGYRSRKWENKDKKEKH